MASFDWSMHCAADKLNFHQLVHGDDYEPFALIILNQPLDSPLFLNIRSRASFTICADGGFNRLLDYAKTSESPLEALLPQLIIGDLDSISNEALDLAKHRGVIVERDSCQDTTDFRKALNALAKYARGELSSKPTVVVFGALDGRFDHTGASISVLYQSKDTRLWLVSNRCAVTLLRAVWKVDRGSW